MFKRESQEKRLAGFLSMLTEALELETIHPTGRLNLVLAGLLLLFAFGSGVWMTLSNTFLRIFEREIGSEYPFLPVFFGLLGFFLLCLIMVWAFSQLEGWPSKRR